MLLHFDVVENSRGKYVIIVYIIIVETHSSIVANYSFSVLVYKRETCQ